MRAPFRNCVAIAVAALIASITLPAWSQAVPDELARRHFESGAAYFEQAEYDSALREFRKSYELSSRPEILINIATVHERLSDLRAAIAALDEYLQLKPDAEANASILLRRNNLQKRLDEQAPPPPAAVTPATEPDRPLTPPPDVEDPEPNRVPAYVLFTVAGASAAGAVLTGVFAQAEFNDLETRCAPNCSDADVGNAQTLATLSTILTGAAVVSAGLGAVFWFTAEPETKAGLSASFAFTGRGPMANAKWTF